MISQFIAIFIGALFIASLAALVAVLYKDKPMQVSPCRTCTADCPSKKLTPEEQKIYYLKEQEQRKAACGPEEKADV